MFGGIQSLGNRGYEMLYAVPATFLYLYYTSSPLRIPVLGEITGFLWIAIDGWILIFAVLCTYGAMVHHKLSILILGDKGGMHSTKSSALIFREALALLTGNDSSDIPPSFLDAIPAAMEGINFRTILRAVPVLFFASGQYIGWVWLSSTLYYGGETVVGSILWLLLSILVFESRVTGFLPQYIPEESVEGIDEAEYKRIRRLVADETATNRPRLK